MGRILYLEHRRLGARIKKPAIGGHTSHISVSGENSRLDGGGRSPDRTSLTLTETRFPITMGKYSIETRDLAPVRPESTQFLSETNAPSTGKVRILMGISRGCYGKARHEMGLPLHRANPQPVLCTHDFELDLGE